MRDKFKDLPTSNSITACYCKSEIHIETMFISDLAKPLSITIFDKPLHKSWEIDPLELWYKAHGLISMCE